MLETQDQTLLHHLHQSQKKIVNKVFYIANILGCCFLILGVCIAGIAFFKNATFVLILGALLAIFGLVILVGAYIILQKINNLNSIASGALNAYDQLKKDHII